MPFPAIHDLEGHDQSTPTSSNSRRNAKMNIWCNLVIVAQIHYKLSGGQAKKNWFWVKMAKMPLKVTVNDAYFQYQLRVSKDACLANLKIPS